MGVQLLVDHGESMIPFFDDAKELSRRIEQIVGRDAVVEQRFVGTPLLGFVPGRGRRTRSDSEGYRLPSPGTPVAVLSDLGIGRDRRLDAGASLTQWVEFARVVQRGGCPLIAFTPYGSNRWPTELRETMHLVHWDRTTDISNVRRALLSKIRGQM